MIPVRVVERRLLGELIVLENRLSRGSGDGQPRLAAVSPGKSCYSTCVMQPITVLTAGSR